MHIVSRLAELMLYASCLPVSDTNVLLELLGSVGPANSTLIYLQSITCADGWTSSTTCTLLMTC